MKAIEVTNISKTFGSLQAVHEVSFDINAGEIFGLLGPNGAGKTTSIRIVLDIFKPDSGQVVVLGGPMSEQKKNLIGYMPEERGLYQDVTLDTCLVYLGTLKGLSVAETKRRLAPLLERFDLAAHKKKKVKELSKGMQQKAQIIATVVHQPELVIVDEPFAGLDPVNTQMVKELILEMSQKGTSILMSTHQMHQVEELCNRILLIHQGCTILYGNLEEIQQRFAGQEVLVHTDSEFPALPGEVRREVQNHSVKLTLAQGVTSQDMLWTLLQQGVQVKGFEIAAPSLEEIFIRMVTGGE
jgi:ABC-2 type transport system ATP-binding protein